MKKNNYDYATLRDMHRAGFLTEAEEGYLALLRKNPRHVDVLHSLGILYAQKENFSPAITYLQKAVDIQPNNPSLQLHLANVYKIQGLLSQAAIILQKVIEQHPEYAAAYNNLGSIYYSQEKLSEAITAFRHAIAKQVDYIDAYYNLGLAFVKQNHVADAIDIYTQLLERSPTHFAARFHLACLHMQQNHLSDAIKQFLTIEQAQPFHFETQTNLATCYLKQGAMNEAKQHYYKALELKVDDSQILFNLGVINMQQGHLDLAIQNYQRVLQQQPDSFAAHNNLGVAFLAKQHIPFALEHFREALRIQPTNASIEYTVQMLSQHHHLLTAPPDYVTSLFDAYADHYEPHLLTALNYQLPAIFEKTIFRRFKFAPHSISILDLGAGTGLCGTIAKPYASSLTGVDLSEKMLAVAAKKNIYDRLIHQDITAFLNTQSDQYDLILAGDVLVYIGALDDVFRFVKQALHPGGLFAFNTEICIDKPFRMNQSGRFGHQQHYLEELAKKYQYSIQHHEIVVTRLQNIEPVQGYLYILKSLNS